LWYRKTETEEKIMDDKERAWVYCRIDAPEDMHGHLKGQREDLISYAGQMGFEVVGESQDLGSGLRLDRNGLRKVTEAADAGKMDVLLVMNITRIGRVMNQTVEFVHHLNKLGVKIYSPLSGEVTTIMPPEELNVFLGGLHIGGR
jgi:DNA invertase Pin-like site-specific DNA recombinase